MKRTRTTTHPLLLTIGRALVLALALLAWGAVAVLAQGIERDATDEFTGSRVVESVGQRIDMSASGRAWTKAAYLDQQYALMLEVDADTWRLVGERNAQVVAYAAEGDTPERFSVQLVRVDSDVQSDGRTYERYGLVLSARQWAAMQDAYRTAFRVAGVTYTLTDGAQREMQLVQARVQ